MHRISQMMILFTVYDMKTADYRGILYNFNNEFWQRNKDAIPAISYAIDRQKMVDSVLLGEGIVAMVRFREINIIMKM